MGKVTHSYILRIVISVLFIVIAITVFYISDAFSQSPSFSRQHVEDKQHDLEGVSKQFDLGKMEQTDTSDLYESRSQECLDNLSSSIDIRSVTFTSNGKFLNATLWLVEPFVNQSSFIHSDTDKPGSNWENVLYGMSLDVESVYDSELGLDYWVTVWWDKETQKWNKSVGEYSTIGNRSKTINEFYNIGNGVYNQTNPINVFKNGEYYVNLSFDLGIANYPKQYKMFFNADSFFSDGCYLADAVNFVSVPPPEYIITTSNSSIEIRRGDETIIPLTIKSMTNLNSLISLEIKGDSDDIQTILHAKNMTILPYETVMTALTIKTSETTSLGSHIIPLEVNVIYPEDIALRMGDNSSVIFDGSNSQIIGKDYVLTANVNPPLNLNERLDQIAEFISPLNSIWTFLVAVSAVLIPLIVRQYSKSNRS